MILIKIQQCKKIDRLSEVVKRWHPKSIFPPAIPAMKHETAAVRGRDYGAMSMSNIEDFNMHHRTFSLGKVATITNTPTWTRTCCTLGTCRCAPA